MQLLGTAIMLEMRCRHLRDGGVRVPLGRKYTVRWGY